MPLPQSEMPPYVDKYATLFAEALAFVFGVACIVKPKFGNFSRSMGLGFVGGAIFIGNPESRFGIVGGLAAVAAAFCLAGIACLRRSPRQAYLPILGVTSIGVGLVCLAGAILLILGPWPLT